MRKRQRFNVPGMMTTYANLKRHTRERSQAMAQDFQTRWSNRRSSADSVAIFCGQHMLDEEPWKHYRDPAGNGKIRDWIEAITGDDFDDVLRWIYGADLETHRRWVEIDIMDQNPSPVQEAQAVKNEVEAKVKAAKAAGVKPKQREIAEAVGISRSRVSEIVGEKGESPSLPTSTIQQQSKIEKKSDYNIKKERKLQREYPQAWQDFKDGKYKSLHAACVAVGAVKTRTPLEQVLYWFGKCSGEEQRRAILESCSEEQLVRILNEMLPEEIFA